MEIRNYIFILVVALLAFFPKPKALASHISEDLFQEVYRELMYPSCQYSNREEGTSLDCENPDPAVFACWKEKLHWDYTEEGILEFLGEIRESNQKYEYFNAPFYNEFFSNRNWDNILKYTDYC